MEIGERVYVETQDFAGMATIDYLAHGEIWPVQIELDEPYDENGQRVYRVDYSEVKEQTKEEPQRHYAKVVRGRNGYRLGDTYIISNPGPNGYYNVYLKNGRCIGSYITNFFEITGPYKERKTKEVVKPLKMPEIEKKEPPGVNTLPEVELIENEPKIEVTGIWIKKDKPKKKKLSMPEQLEAIGQLNIFDLLEG